MFLRSNRRVTGDQSSVHGPYLILARASDGATWALVRHLTMSGPAGRTLHGYAKIGGRRLAVTEGDGVRIYVLDKANAELGLDLRAFATHVPQRVADAFVNLGVVRPLREWAKTHYDLLTGNASRAQSTPPRP